MFRFKRPFFHFGSGCLLTDEAARLMLGSGTIWNVSGMHAVGGSSIMGEVLRVHPTFKMYVYG